MRIYLLKLFIGVILTITLCYSLVEFSNRLFNRYYAGERVLIIGDNIEGNIVIDLRPIGPTEVRYKDKNGVFHTASFRHVEIKSIK